MQLPTITSYLDCMRKKKPEKASTRAGKNSFNSHAKLWWKWRKIVMFVPFLDDNLNFCDEWACWQLNVIEKKKFTNENIFLIWKFLLEVFNRMVIYWKAFIFKQNICLIKSFSLDSMEHLILSSAIFYQKRKCEKRKFFLGCWQ